MVFSKTWQIKLSAWVVVSSGRFDWGRIGSQAHLGHCQCSSHWGVGLRASVSLAGCWLEVALVLWASPTCPMCFIKASKRKYLLLRRRLHYVQHNQSQNVLGSHKPSPLAISCGWKISLSTLTRMGPQKGLYWDSRTP